MKIIAGTVTGAEQGGSATEACVAWQSVRLTFCHANVGVRQPAEAQTNPHAEAYFAHLTDNLTHMA